MNEQSSKLKSLEWFEGHELALYQVASFLGSLERSPLTELRDRTLAILSPLLDRELIQAGRLLAPREVDPRDWVPLDLPTPAVIDLIRRIWDDQKRHPELLDDIWFVLTPRGQDVLAREREAEARGSSDLR